MENLITTLTNLPMLAPIYYAYSNTDYLTTFIISFVFTGSFISHLIENHKHGMPGFIKVSKNTSYYWNRMDVIGCVLVIFRFVHLYFKHIPDITIIDMILILFALSLNVISEYDKFNPQLKWFPYLTLHSLWHIMAGHLMYIFLQKIY